jgi:hypothetical protein
MSAPDAPNHPVPRAPTGLDRRGRSLWKSVAATFDLSEGELALLLEACRCLDDVEALQGELVGAPMTTVGSRGQEVVHPLRAELRSERLLLAKLLGQLDVPMPDDTSGAWDGLSASARARKAASARWHGGSR